MWYRGSIQAEPLAKNNCPLTILRLRPPSMPLVVATDVLSEGAVDRVQAVLRGARLTDRVELPGVVMDPSSL